MGKMTFEIDVIWERQTFRWTLYCNDVLVNHGYGKDLKDAKERAKYAINGIVL